MDWRNRIGLYGAYFLGMAGIGFTLPYLPLYLSEQGLSDRTIGLISTLAALAGLAQFPIGIWSDRLNRRKPFLVGALALLALATFLLDEAQGVIWLGLLVVLFAENGACRATLESLAGAEATHLAPPDQVGAALGALRFWKPLGILSIALAGGFLAERFGAGLLLLPLAVVQGLAVVAALLIHEKKTPAASVRQVLPSTNGETQHSSGLGLKDRGLWIFVLAMVLFHVANSPPGVYLGLFLKRDLQAPEAVLAHAFVVSMLSWMLAIRVAGWLCDRWGRRPLLIAGWSVMTARLMLVSLAEAPWQVLAIQALDGAAQALFAVAAAAWVTDRLADARRVGEAQVLVGSALVFGSAVGPLLAGLVVGAMGYRGMFGLLAGIGALATAILVMRVPETLGAQRPAAAAAAVTADCVSAL